MIHDQNTNKPTAGDSDEISLKELIIKMGEWYRYLKTKWLIITLAGFLGGVIGFFYAWMQPITYTAKTTFVVEEGKSGGGGLAGLASLAGQFGVDVGGGSGGGLMSGDNILLYFKSASLAREVLLSKYDEASNLSVADKYAEVYKLKDAWEKNKKVGKVNFPVFAAGVTYARIQDSLIQVITESINKKQFNIAKPDKKAGFIEVSTTMEDELLAKTYCDRILEAAVKRYMAVKTKRQKSTVDNLQSRADSIMALLNRKTATSAAIQSSSAAMDLNPLYRAGTTIAVETSTRDKTILATMFGEITKNLELAKFTLSQETPVIQVVDASGLPLKKEKSSRLKTGLGFAIGFGFVTVLFFIGRKLFQGILEKD
jgi:hypothetical protein